MLYISPTNSKRFNLYHMDENEIYIQDFFGSCSFFDFNLGESRLRDKGKFYLCSKSIVFESDNKNTALLKLKFEYIKQLPTFGTSVPIQPPTTSSSQPAGSPPSEWPATRPQSHSGSSMSLTPR